MTCHEFGARLHAYVDGELGVAETLDADAHAAICATCRALAAEERRQRELLRRQPRETAPPELRARIVAAIEREAARTVRRRWAVTGAAAVVVVAAAVLSGLSVMRVPPAGVVGRLVDTHSAYARLEGPAEFASTAPADVESWFQRRAGLRVPVPDYTSAGIRLIGGRVAAVGERQAAYVLYEKGHTLLSVFMVPLDTGEREIAGPVVHYRGHDYVTQERRGFRTVVWTETADARTVVYGLVSMLDWDALLECADRLRAERAGRPGA